MSPGDLHDGFGRHPEGEEAWPQDLRVPPAIWWRALLGTFLVTLGVC